MVQSKDKVLLRKVNIVSWESAAFQQANKEFGINGIPAIFVFGKNGEKLGEKGGIEEIRAAVDEALAH